VSVEEVLRTVASGRCSFPRDHAVQPWGHTAGLKEKRNSDTMSAHPGGWQSLVRGSSSSGRRNVVVSGVTKKSVRTSTLVVCREAQLVGHANGVVMARMDVAVGDRVE